MAEVATTTIVTLSEMRSFLNIPTAQTAKDNLIIDLLDSYNTMIEDYIGVALITKSYTESYDGDGKDTLFLKHYPIVSVTTLTVDSTALTASDYYSYGTEGYIRLDSDTFSTDDPQNIAIVYTAGHGASRSAVSKVLKLALKTWVARVFKAEVIDFSQQFDESSLAHIKSTMMPWDVKQMLDPYRCRHW